MVFGAAGIEAGALLRRLTRARGNIAPIVGAWRPGPGDPSEIGKTWA
jgi:hypothetical protein